MKLSALRRDRLSEVIGRTPPDWDLQDEDGISFYLEFTVRRDTVEGWLSHQSTSREWMQEAQARGLAGLSSGAANGARRHAGGKFKPLVGNGPREIALKEAYLDRMRRPRDERRKETQEAIDGIREHLLAEVMVCATDRPPISLKDLGKAVADAPEDREEAAVKDMEDELAPERWLAIGDEPISRRPLTDFELVAFFTAQLPDDEAPFLLPQEWTFATGLAGSVTVSEGICSVILSLAALASRGVEVERRAELQEVKERPSSGQNAPLGEEKAEPTSRAAN